MITEMQSAVRRVLSNYATFSGRASRPEFWWWALSVFLFILVLNIIDAFLIAPMFGVQGIGDQTAQPLSALAALALFIPNIAVAARRLHDIGRTGWWLLIGLIPIIGFLVLVYFYVQPSEEGANTWGPRTTL